LRVIQQPIIAHTCLVQNTCIRVARCFNIFENTFKQTRKLADSAAAIII